MANFVFNIAKGRVAELAQLLGTGDGLIAVPIETTGIVTDATMRDYDTLAALLAGASNEQTTMGRKGLASVTSAVNDTDDRWEVDAADISWVGATGNAVSAVVICYAPTEATALAGTTIDATCVPLVKLDMVVTPSGGDITLVFGSGGFFQAA